MMFIDACSANDTGRQAEGRKRPGSCWSPSRMGCAGVNRTLRCLTLLLATLPLFVGCGGGDAEETVTARGRLTNAGQPLTVQGMDVGIGMIQVEFYRIGPDGKQLETPETATVDADGYFNVTGRGGGLPPGKYKIAVRQWDPYPQVDKLQGRFDAQNSPIVREITGDGDLLIDLSKPEG